MVRLSSAWRVLPIKVDLSVVDSFPCIGATDNVFSIVNIHKNDARAMI